MKTLFGIIAIYMVIGCIISLVCIGYMIKRGGRLGDNYEYRWKGGWLKFGLDWAIWWPFGVFGLFKGWFITRKGR